MLHNLDEEERIKAILTVLDHNCNVVLKINEVISRLTEKRVTLEEKMIRIYFHKFAANLVSCSAVFHQGLAEAYEDVSARHAEKSKAIVAQATDLLKHANALEELLAASEGVIDELLKILRYDLNFLEQYYEYDFYTRLTEERNFVEQSRGLVAEMVEKKG